MYYWATIKDPNYCREHSLPKGAFIVPLYGYIKLQNQVLRKVFTTEEEETMYRIKKSRNLYEIQDDCTFGNHSCILSYNVQDLVRSIELHGKCELSPSKISKKILQPWNELVKIIRETLPLVQVSEIGL